MITYPASGVIVYIAEEPSAMLEEVPGEIAPFEPEVTEILRDISPLALPIVRNREPLAPQAFGTTSQIEPNDAPTGNWDGNSKVILVGVCSTKLASGIVM